MKIKKKANRVHDIILDETKVGEATYYCEWGNKPGKGTVYIDYADILLFKDKIKSKKYIYNQILQKDVKKFLKNLKVTLL